MSKPKTRSTATSKDRVKVDAVSERIARDVLAATDRESAVRLLAANLVATRKLLRNKVGTAERSARHYSGDASREFWDRINRIKGTTRWERWEMLYFAGVLLQEMEERVLAEVDRK